MRREFFRTLSVICHYDYADWRGACSHQRKMPTSLVGPPQSVAIAPDESFALVTAATKLDPADKKKTAPHNIVSVIDLKANPPAVIATHETGVGASGVAINPAPHSPWSPTVMREPSRCSPLPARP